MTKETFLSCSTSSFLIAAASGPLPLAFLFLLFFAACSEICC